MTTDTEPVQATYKASSNDGVELVKEVRDIVRDLMPHRAEIYWLDFTVSYLIAGATIIGALTQTGLGSACCVLVAGFATYRLSIFTHELSHAGDGKFRAFRNTWDILFGIPAMMPSFMYGDHKSHHVNHSYGTEKDAEYFPLAHGPIRVVVFYFAQVIFLPLGGILRFAVLSPLSILNSTFRKFVWQRFSSIALINPAYRRTEARPKERRAIIVQEVLTTLWCWTIIGCLVSGVIPWSWLLTMYCVFCVGASANYYRALGAHRYIHKGEPMSYTDQLLDSTTVEGLPILTELVAPLGMRYHALHHLVPSLPYHSMGQAHRRLLEHLPSDSAYRDTIEPSISAAVWQVTVRAWRRGQTIIEVSAAP